MKCMCAQTRHRFISHLKEFFSGMESEPMLIPRRYMFQVPDQTDMLQLPSYTDLPQLHGHSDISNNWPY